MYEDDRQSWIDLATDGRSYRSLLYLLWTFSTGFMYLPLLAAGFGMSFGLSFILIGLPLLVLMFAGSRGLADIDRKIGGVLLDKATLPLINDIPPGQSVFTRLGAYLTSATTWLSIVYLLTRFAAGMLALAVFNVMLPLFLIEILILAPLGISRSGITVQVLNALAGSIHNFSASLLPTVKDTPRRRSASERAPREKPKRDDYERLQVIDEDDPYYGFEDDEDILRGARR
ncbi:MAG: sensor domain-containing protein [Chloroflexi bacterium]|nr:sensor domain-containing protein [Chloroflexota bacterium]